jgi:hypothetical protein
MRVPVQAKTLGLVSDELNLSINLSKGGRVERVLRPVKDKDLAVHAECRENIRILGLVSSLVHFSRMLDLLDNIALDSRDITRLSVATDLTSFLIVVVGVGRHSLGNLYIGNLEIVGTFIRGMSAKQEAVNFVVLALGLLDIGEPLDCEGRPS